MSQFDAAVQFLTEKIKEWYEVARDRPAFLGLPDAEIEQLMCGHPMMDDPPIGYGRAKRLVWARGYLHGRSVMAGNVAEMVNMALGAIAPDFQSSATWESDLSKRHGLSVIAEYAFTLKTLLDEFTEGSLTSHGVRVLVSPEFVMVEVCFLHYPTATYEQFIETQVANRFRILTDFCMPIRDCEHLLSTETGIHIHQDQVTIVRPSNAHFWSNVWAWNDSTEIICRILTSKSIALTDEVIPC